MFTQALVCNDIYALLLHGISLNSWYYVIYEYRNQGGCLFKFHMKPNPVMPGDLGLLLYNKVPGKLLILAKPSKSNNPRRLKFAPIRF